MAERGARSGVRGGRRSRAWQGQLSAPGRGEGAGQGHLPAPSRGERIGMMKCLIRYPQLNGGGIFTPWFISWLLVYLLLLRGVRICKRIRPSKGKLKQLRECALTSDLLSIFLLPYLCLMDPYTTPMRAAIFGNKIFSGRHLVYHNSREINLIHPI